MTPIASREWASVERPASLAPDPGREVSPRLRTALGLVACLLVGIVIGGALFARTQPRSILALKECNNCMSPEDLAGLLGAVGMQVAPGAMPFVVYETDKSIALREPLPRGHLHYVIIPKRDIKNIGEITPADSAYLLDALLVSRHLIEKDRMHKYRFYTNGPGLQSVTYLHFHLEDNYY